jgi:putative oxygen-independent coproporphyrinogen III oxidase
MVSEFKGIPIQSTELSQHAARAKDWMRDGTLSLSSLPPLSLYIHLPWCLKKCPYCDFNSHELRGAESGAVESASAVPQRAYIDALIADLEATLPLIWGRSVVSIFIGGGTPSLFEPSAIDELLGAVRARVRLEPGCEITLEANPGTFERGRFAGYAQAGVTRLSVGVQSFNDAHLHTLGRVHSAAQAQAALIEAAAHFNTFNIDLMYALPSQSLDELRADLATALSFNPPHLSIYQLTMEPNTVFAKYPPTGLPDDDTGYAMLDVIVEGTAAAGLKRYEVSAFAKDGHHCAHNLNYWQFGDYIGIGAGAHGKLSFAHRIARTHKKRDPSSYMQAAAAGNANAEEREIARNELPFEYMLNALRLREGFLLADYCERTGLAITSIAQALDTAEAKALVTRDLHRVKPTERGFDFLSDLQELFL